MSFIPRSVAGLEQAGFRLRRFKCSIQGDWGGFGCRLNGHVV